MTVRSLHFRRLFASPIDHLLAALLLSSWPFYRILHRALKLHMKRNNGRIPRHYFETLPQVIPQASLELLVIEEGPEGDSIYLAQRPADDPYWPNELHFPGTTMYAHDTFTRMLNRLLGDEMGNQVDSTALQIEFVHCTTTETRERGAGLHVVCSLTCAPGVIDTSRLAGAFYPMEVLPTNLIDHQRHMLAARGRRRSTNTIPLVNGQ